MSFRSMFGVATVFLVMTPWLTPGPLGQIPAQAHPLLLAQAARQGESVQLKLVAEKQAVETDANGKRVVIWKPTAGQKSQPGDILRFTLSAENTTDKPVNNLVLTQPVPPQAIYVLNSASRSDLAGFPVMVTYSIDGGDTFGEKPLVEVTLPGGAVEKRPAPASTYTHVRWRLGGAIPAKQTVQVTYQVLVR